MEPQPILEMRNITKVYPNGVVANHNMNFSACEGEIHALMGENGAGKSTLVKIMFGIEAQDEGDIYLNGQKVKIENPQHAIRLGIGMVHQHFMLVPSLTVTENIMIGIEPKKNGIFFDYASARKQTLAIAEKYKLMVDPDARIADLDVGKKQKVEILKALIRGAKILILDEPTAVLTPQETDELFTQLNYLKQDGHTVIFISHKLNEIKDICDRITIMRAGKGVGVYQVADVTKEDISRLMIGREITSKIEKTKSQPAETVLKVRDMVVKDSDGVTVVNKVSLSVRKGEILGIAGVEGNGQREFIDGITGLAPFQAGSVSIDGIPTEKMNIHQLRNVGMAHIPEDRMTFGAVKEASIEDNLISERYYTKEYSNKVFLRFDKIKQLSDTLIDQYKILTGSSKTPVGTLSGGNIQKVVAAREMSANPHILISDQPTRGIDVGAARFIHTKLIDMRDEGKAILLVSADINEVLNLSDSLVVFCDGEISAYFEDASTITEDELGLYMLGIKKMPEEEIRRVAYD